MIASFLVRGVFIINSTGVELSLRLERTQYSKSVFKGDEYAERGGAKINHGKIKEIEPFIKHSQISRIYSGRGQKT